MRQPHFSVAFLPEFRYDTYTLIILIKIFYHHQFLMIFTRIGKTMPYTDVRLQPSGYIDAAEEKRIWKKCTKF